VLRKELAIGLVNGSALGLLIGGVAWFYAGNPYLGLVVGSALAVNTLVAVLIGGTVPLLLKRLGQDPAVGAGPLLTTVTDMCGFFLVLSLASGATNAGGSAVGRGGPGGFDGGGVAVPTGRVGQGPAGGQGGYYTTIGSQPAVHGGHGTAGVAVLNPFGQTTQTSTYGSGRPFDLRGGSGGGGHFSSFAGVVNFVTGGGGGGVLVLLADGSVTINGCVRADGGGAGGATFGAGGSIMIRSADAVVVSGTVSASGARTGNWPQVPNEGSGDGFVRIDASRGAPQVTGSTAGYTRLIELPALETVSPMIGTPWDVTVLPRPGDSIAVFVAAAGASLPTPFGLLGLDPASMQLLGTGAASPGALEPDVTVRTMVPALSALVGARIHTQAIASDGAGYLRLTRAVSAPIR
jgi:hypothetical protein